MVQNGVRGRREASGERRASVAARTRPSKRTTARTGADGPRRAGHEGRPSVRAILITPVQGLRGGAGPPGEGPEAARWRTKSASGANNTNAATVRVVAPKGGCPTSPFPAHLGWFGRPVAPWPPCRCACRSTSRCGAAVLRAPCLSTKPVTDHRKETAKRRQPGERGRATSPALQWIGSDATKGRKRHTIGEFSSKSKSKATLETRSAAYTLTAPTFGTGCLPSGYGGLRITGSAGPRGEPEYVGN
jgi:hypothetical protein